MAIIEIKNFSFSFFPEKKILDNISLKIEEGEFVILTGKTGAGKTTLLKLLKYEISPYGKKEGEILYNGKEIGKEKIRFNEIGYMFQNPDDQIVSSKVYSEMAFGLEYMRLSQNEMSQRIGEVATYLGLERIFNKDTLKLSTGEKQLLNLGSLMCMKPKVLLLDEAASSFDPITKANYFSVLERLNKEMGITIIIIDHDLEDIISFADRIVIIENKKIVFNDTPHALINLQVKDEETFNVLPAATKICLKLEKKSPIPLTVKDCKRYLKSTYKNDYKELKVKKEASKEIITIKDLSFKYDDSSFILKDLSLKINKGEVLTIVGGNGCGKTTLAKVICGIYQNYEGKIKIGDIDVKTAKKQHHSLNISYLPQNPLELFVNDEVEQEFLEITQDHELINDITTLLHIKSLMKQNPYDLSGGEAQKVGLGKILLKNPLIVVLDEVTKGLDYKGKKQIINIIKKLKEKGVTIINVTHDLEFASLISTRIALLFDGKITSIGDTHEFLSMNDFYTTSASRISRGMYNNTVTIDEVVSLAKRNGLL